MEVFVNTPFVKRFLLIPGADMFRILRLKNPQASLMIALRIKLCARIFCIIIAFIPVFPMFRPHAISKRHRVRPVVIAYNCKQRHLSVHL
jgi:hypothetical protein